MSRHACHVCGRGPQDAYAIYRQNRTGKPGIWACEAHRLRIKCSIDGCRRTTAKTRADDSYQEWICGEHWRRYCPPRSRRRRAYHAFFRRAKREGWSDDLAARYWRFWDTLVASAQARAAAGTVDMTEINKIMGWDDDQEA